MCVLVKFLLPWYLAHVSAATPVGLTMFFLVIACPALLDFQNFLLGSSIPLFLKCNPKRRTWHVLGLFPSLWPYVVEGWSGMVGRWSEGGRKVVGRWSGGGREVFGRWSEVVGGWSEVVGGGRSVVGSWSFGGCSLVLKVWYCWSFTCFHIWVMQCNSSRDLLFKHGLYRF